MAKTLYHVAPDAYDGGDLESLYRRLGDDAYDEYLARWPESGNLGTYHAHYVHLYDTLDAARDHQVEHGGRIVAIDADALAEAWIEIQRDRLEFDHPYVEDAIPAEFCRVVAA